MCTHLFDHLTLEHVEFAVGLVQSILQQHNVLLIFFALYHDFLDGAFLLSQYLDGFSVSSLLFLQFQFQITDAGFQFADDALATGNGVQFNFFQADGQVLQWNKDKGNYIFPLIPILQENNLP